MLFLGVRGFSDYAGPTVHSRLAWLTCCLPPTRNEVGILIYGLFAAQSPRPPMPLVYASRNTSRCPLQDSRSGWIRYFLSCRALASPTTCRFIPAHVAVGTTIADRPPHRSVLARLRIRLLRRMSGVEACIRIGMQNPGWWNPPVQDWGKSFPPHLGALAPADQNTLPEPAHAKLKDAQLSRVPGDCVVLVITQHNLPEPCTDFGHAIMHSALKLNLDGFEFRNHSLFRSNPPYGEGSALVALPTVVGKAQKREGLWFSLSPLFPVASGEPPELDQSSLVRM